MFVEKLQLKKSLSQIPIRVERKVVCRATFFYKHIIPTGYFFSTKWGKNAMFHSFTV